MTWKIPDEYNIKEVVLVDIRVDVKNLVKKTVIHQVYPDTQGRIYCRQLNKVTKFDWESCYQCPLLGGSAQGGGVECVYEDMVDKHIFTPHIAEASTERLRISGLIDSKLLPVEPKRGKL